MITLDNLKAYKRRVYDDDDYLIPVDLVDEFDKLVSIIDGDEQETDVWYDAIDKFVDKFSIYVVEGEQYDIVYYIDPKDLTS